jgi:hypothetical protein
MKTDLFHHIATAGTMVYQKADLWHPAFIPSGVMNSDVSEVTETDEDVLILNVPNARTPCGCCGRAGHHGICGLRKVVWRPAHKVRGVEGRSHIVCSCCYLRGACRRAWELNVPGRMGTRRSLTDDSEVNHHSVGFIALCGSERIHVLSENDDWVEL